MKITPAKNKQTGQDGYRLDVTVSNQRVRRWFARLDEAREALSQLTLEKRARKIGLPLPEKQQAVTLAELFIARERESQNNRNWPAVRASLEEFVSHCPPDVRLADVTAEYVADYLATLQQRNLNPNTINHYLRGVAALLNSAARHFPKISYIVPPIPYLAPALTTDRVLTGEEMAKIYAALTKQGRLFKGEVSSAQTRRREFIGDLFMACALTGARPSEILSLTWPQISFAFSTLTLNSAKTDDRRTLPLTNSLRELFERRQSSNPAAPFPRVCYTTITYQLESLGEAIGLAYGERTGWTLKTLRHTAISTMLRLNADFLSVSAIVGHIHAPSRFGNSMTLHYAHSSQAGMRQAMELLDAYWREANESYSREAKPQSLPRLARGTTQRPASLKTA